MKNVVAMFLVALLATFGSWGCASTTSDSSRTHGAPGAQLGSVAVAIYDRPSEVGGAPSTRTVHSRLSRLDGKDLVTVHEATGSRWSVDLPPGKYVFQLIRWVDVDGTAHGNTTEEDFNLSAGDTVLVKAVLQDRRRNTAVTLGVVGGAALLLGTILYVDHQVKNTEWKLNLSQWR